MLVIKTRNVHQALPLALGRLDRVGVKRDSRNGPVIMFPTPVTTVYERPNERVIFWHERDANPFFHLLEALWMLAGRNDVEYVVNIVSRMAEYSDDGVTFNGAYGYRWRHHFGHDQLENAIQQLCRNPDDRRVVVSMWDGFHDSRLAATSKDVPCNTQIYFSVGVDGRLDMTVCNRSNDLVWGCYGANAVHMSLLQEYVAASLEREVGVYYQMSNNLHAYEATLSQVRELALKEPDPFRRSVDCPYHHGVVKATPLLEPGDTPAGFHRDLQAFMKDELDDLETSFFRHTAAPMRKALLAWKQGQKSSAYHIVDRNMSDDSDWKLAAMEWMERRIANQSATK